MATIISPDIQEKLTNKHRVTPEEVDECIANRTGMLLVDDREEHATDPPTQWFIATTDRGRVLKVVFVRRGQDLFVKSVHEPSQRAIKEYEEYHK